MLNLAPPQSQVKMRAEIFGKLPEVGIYDCNGKSAYAFYCANIWDAPSDRDVRGEGKRGATPAMATGASG